MVYRSLLVILISSILLVSCAPAAQPAEPAASGVRSPTVNAVQTTGPASPDTAEAAPDDQPAVTQSASASPAAAEPTLIPCPGALTSPNQEGPFYKTGSPERESLIDEGLPGTPILITGRVFDQDCNPMPGVKLDFWLADVDGQYDNTGYTLRGHQVSDQNGYYAIESIEPTAYTGRPPHIHVKLFAPDGRELLTTQMYFPGSEGSPDVQNSPDLLATYLETDIEGRQVVMFNFVVQN